jgi:uncharacterized protein (TIGR02391 family)
MRQTPVATIQSFDEVHLEQICSVLGDTGTGLTGGEIGEVLRQLGIPDPFPTMTKRKRLHAALSERQRTDGCGNYVVAFIHKSMEPVRYVSNRELFDTRRHGLNDVLVFCGLSVGDDGKLQTTQAVRTLDEAEERADRLRVELRRRNVHPDVLKFCRAELVRNNYFHAVLEATKSVAEKLRGRTGVMSDGSKLVDEVFGSGTVGMPFLAFNTLTTETERNEHTGMMNMMKGMFSAFRNTTAHAPKISWTITEQDAMDILSMVSLLHRRIDGAARTPRQV